MPIGKVEVVPVREAFPHEALNFTAWLADNIDALSDRIGIELTVEDREQAVGSFNVDLVCRAVNDPDTKIIIENQLERTDHDHLGKVLTYMVNLGATTAIWVATDVRPEHERVIDWLNQTAGRVASFYFVKVEAIRIGDSPYAPLFTVLVRPDEQTTEIGEQKKELAEREVLRSEFWEQLLSRSKGKTALTANKSASHDHWLAVAAGRSGINYNYLILKDGAAVDVYIDFGDQDRNKAAFDQLYAQQEAIEAEFGEPLDWRRLDEKRSSRIVKTYIGMGSLREQDKWPELQELLIDAMIRLDKALRHRIRLLRI